MIDRLPLPSCLHRMPRAPGDRACGPDFL